MDAIAIAGREDDQDVLVQNRLVEIAVIAVERRQHRGQRGVERQRSAAAPAVVDDAHLARIGQVDDVLVLGGDDLAVDDRVLVPKEVARRKVGGGGVELGVEGVAEHRLSRHAVAGDGAGHVGAVTFPAAARVDQAVIAVAGDRLGAQARHLASRSEQRVIDIDAGVIDPDRLTASAQPHGVGVFQPQEAFGIVDGELAVRTPGGDGRLIVRRARSVGHVETAGRRRGSRSGLRHSRRAHHDRDASRCGQKPALETETQNKPPAACGRQLVFCAPMTQLRRTNRRCFALSSTTF